MFCVGLCKCMCIAVTLYDYQPFVELEVSEWAAKLAAGRQSPKYECRFSSLSCVVMLWLVNCCLLIVCRNCGRFTITQNSYAHRVQTCAARQKISRKVKNQAEEE